MEGEPLAQHLRDAERRLAEATARLRAALSAVFAGDHSDMALLDQAVWAYHDAKRAVEAASLDWQRWQRDQAPAVREDPAAAPALLFARWLYEHGLIAG